MHHDGSIPWPHAPPHQLGETGTFFVTASTYHKAHYFRGPDRLAVLHRGLLKMAARYGWQLEAWAVFSNHYHFVGRSPIGEDDSRTLSPMLKMLHVRLSGWINKLDNTPGRRIWFQFRETRLTYQRSYFARLNYVHQKRGETRACACCKPIPLVFRRLAGKRCGQLHS